MSANTTGWDKILLYVVMFLLTIAAAMAATTYTPTSKKTCTNGICTEIIGSGILYGVEDGKWKNLEDMKSWKGTGVECYVIEDDITTAECLDWNLTDVTIKAKYKHTENDGKKISIKLKSYINGTKVKIKEETLYHDTYTTMRIKYDGKEVHIGENSTTIMIRVPDVDNIEDVSIDNDSGTPNTNYGTQNYIKLQYGAGTHEGLIKWDMTQFEDIIPIQVNISFHYFQHQFDAGGDYFNSTVHHYYNQTWNETTPTYNNFYPITSARYNTTAEDYVKVSQALIDLNYTITNMFTKAYNDGDDNLSIYIKTGPQSQDSNDDTLSMGSKEHITPVYRPRLSISYHDISNYTIQVSNAWNGTALTSFSASIVGDTTYTTNNGVITTGLLNNDTNTYDITLSADGYYDRTYYTQTIGNDSNYTLIPENDFINITFNDTVNYSMIDYAGNVWKGTDNNITVLADDIANGHVYIRFGYGANDTIQYYEFIKASNTSLNETLYIMTDTSVPFYFKVEKRGGTPLTDAILHFYEIQPDWNFFRFEAGNYSVRKLSLTRTETIVYLNPKKEYRVWYEKDGFRGDIFYIQLGLLTNWDTASEAKTFVLRETDYSTNDDVWTIIVPPRWSNRSITIYGETYGRTIDNVLILTDYRNSTGSAQGLELYDNPSGYMRTTTAAVNSYYNFHYWSLQPNVDYNASGTSNITLYIYTYDDNTWTLSQTLQITYDTSTTEQDFLTITTFRTNKTTALLLLIALILLAGTFRYFTQSNETGFNAFLIGCILMTAVSYYFILPAIIAGIYYLGRIYMKSTGDVT